MRDFVKDVIKVLLSTDNQKSLAEIKNEEELEIFISYIESREFQLFSKRYECSKMKRKSKSYIDDEDSKLFLVHNSEEKGLLTVTWAKVKGNTLVSSGKITGIILTDSPVS